MRRDIGRVSTGLLATSLAALAAGACTHARAEGSRSASAVATTAAAARPSGAQAAGTGAAGTQAAGVQVRQPRPGMAWVIFGKDTVRAEVARTDAQRERGLMYRDSVPSGTGMLFVFDQMGPQSFWMENTYVPLDIAFLNASYAVVDIQQMAPLTTTPHQSAAPAMFALEVAKGWFEKHGIHVGSVPKIEFGPQLLG